MEGPSNMHLSNTTSAAAVAVTAIPTSTTRAAVTVAGAAGAAGAIAAIRAGGWGARETQQDTKAAATSAHNPHATPPQRAQTAIAF